MSKKRIPEKERRSQQGVALVLTLMAVSFLVAVTVQLFSTVNWQMQSAGNMADSIQLDAMTLSGLNLVRTALVADDKENNFDSLQDSWNTLDPERVSALMGRGRMEITVTDLSGRLQVNALVSPLKEKKGREQEQQQRELWLRFLTSGRFAVEDRDQAESLVDAIKDWIDENDLEEEKGAESGYYQGLSPPYSAHNGPVSYPEEMLLIRGMTPELFYGNDEHSGLGQFITVVGRDGKINLNSAPPELIQSLAPGIDEEAAAKLVEFRQEKNNREILAEPAWYRQVSSFPGDVEIPQELLTIKSHCFMVTTKAENGGIARTGTGVLIREDDGPQQLISWEVR